MKTLYATIKRIERANNSVNGNPNYTFLLLEADNPHDAISGQNGAHYVDRRTSSDISDSYGIIPNECKVGASMAYTITAAGRIRHVIKVVDWK